jgi:hypothetical protein
MRVSWMVQIFKLVLLILAAQFMPACTPSASRQVNIDAVLKQPQHYDGEMIQVTACIKQFHHGVLLGRCKSDDYETAVFSDLLPSDQQQAFGDIAFKTYLGKAAPHCLTGRFRFAAGRVSSQWLELRTFTIGPCAVSSPSR